MLAKSSIGISTPFLYKSTDALQRLFLCLRITTPTKIVLYGFCVGQPSGWPVSCAPVVLTPHSAHPNSISTEQGGLVKTQYKDNTMPPLSVCDKSISIRNNLYSLNDLHRAAGGEDKHKPAFFLRNEQTQALIAEIDKVADLQLKSSDVRISYEVVRGANGGTYACRELVYAYAMWISPKFNLAVIRAFDQLTQTPQLNAPAAPMPPHHKTYDPNQFYLVHKSALDSGACILTPDPLSGWVTASPIPPEAVPLLKAAKGFVEAAKQEGMLIINSQDLLAKLGVKL